MRRNKRHEDPTTGIGAQRKQKKASKLLRPAKTLDSPILLLFAGDTDMVEIEPPLRRLDAGNVGLIISWATRPLESGVTCVTACPVCG